MKLELIEREPIVKLTLTSFEATVLRSLLSRVGLGPITCTTQTVEGLWRGLGGLGIKSGGDLGEKYFSGGGDLTVRRGAP